MSFFDPNQPFKVMWKRWTAICLVLCTILLILWLIFSMVMNPTFWYLYLLFFIPLYLIVILFSLNLGFAFAILQWLFFTPADREIVFSIKNKDQSEEY